MGVFKNHVRGVVGRDLGESEILLRHKNLVYPAMTPPMQRVQGGIGAHFLQPGVEPRVVVVSENGAQDTRIVPDLKQRSISRNVLLANYSAEDSDGPERAEQGDFIVAGEGNLLDTFAKLDRLSLVETHYDPGGAIVMQVLDVAPANLSIRVDFAVGPGN